MSRKSVVERFFEKVEIRPIPQCWPWVAWVNNMGYGQMSIPSRDIQRGDRTVLAHRISWILQNEQPIPEGLDILHLCDNKRCVNPAHLKPGTASENARMIDPARLRSQSKITEVIACQIRGLIVQGEKQRVIAERYGITQSEVSRINTHDTWRAA